MMRLFHKQSQLEKFNNPFYKKNVDKITFEIYDHKNAMFRNDCFMEAEIRFENGNTKGYHKIYSNDFVELVLRTQNFIDGL